MISQTQCRGRNLDPVTNERVDLSCVLSQTSQTKKKLAKKGTGQMGEGRLWSIFNAPNLLNLISKIYIIIVGIVIL